MRHKLKIWSACWGSGRRLWYTSCQGCRWEPGTRAQHPDGQWRFGRPTLAAALDVGIAHQAVEQGESP